MAQEKEAPPDTEVFDVADVGATPLPIDPCTWELVNEVLGYPASSATRVTGFWDALIQATPSVRADGSVTRSAPFPRPARGLHRLVPTAGTDRLYSGQLTLTMSTREWYPSQCRSPHSETISNGFSSREDARRNPQQPPCRARLVLENLRALPSSCCPRAPAPYVDPLVAFVDRTWDSLVAAFTSGGSSSSHI